MQRNSFSAYVTARKLACLFDDETLLPSFASSSIAVYPYQIAAARFALRSPYLKGCILCDEGSLGKTYEALLVAAQKWYEGKDRLLVVLPSNLVKQWTDRLEADFSLPYFVWNAGDNLPDNDGLTIVTYDFAVRHADVIGEKPWDLVIFDEADVLSKPQNKTVATLKAVTDGSFKLLLTPTPITMSIMDIYGLIHFIDETVLPEADDFYKRYFRKPDNYPELTSWVSQFAFRTLKSQVTEYVNFTNRLPLTISYALSPTEKALYEAVTDYLAQPKKLAYPQMEPYELTLMFFHTLSSSAQAFSRTLNSAIARIDDGAEKVLLSSVKFMADSVNTNSKSKLLLDVLNKCFAKLKQLKLPQKAIVFVDNLTTLDVLADLLIDYEYNVIRTTQPDYFEKFKGESAAVLIATDAAAKGLDMAFCPVVINYDMLYNAIELEQRISRCHRQGQRSDVAVFNLLCKDNPADVRILELINKRTLQFDGIFGMSDEIVGSFDQSVDDLLLRIRKPADVQEAFTANLSDHEIDNKRLISNAEDTLFTTFTKAVADKIAVTPKYIEDRATALNDELWDVVRFYFSTRDDYAIDEQAKTITLRANTPPHLFYYWTGSRNKPYIGQRQYGANKDFKPSGGRITLTSALAKGILSTIACADSGELTMDASVEPCEIGFYEVSIQTNWSTVSTHSVLVGKTRSGDILSDARCREILDLPVRDCVENGKLTEYWLRNSSGNMPFHELDSIVPTDALVQKTMQQGDSAISEEVERIKLRAGRKKTALEHTLDDIRTRIKSVKLELAAESGDRLKELTLGKQLKLLEKELRTREQNLFYEQMRVNVAAEEEISALTSKEKYIVSVKRHFVIRVRGENWHEQENSRCYLAF